MYKFLYHFRQEVGYEINILLCYFCDPCGDYKIINILLSHTYESIITYSEQTMIYNLTISIYKYLNKKHESVANISINMCVANSIILYIYML